MNQNITRDLKITRELEVITLQEDPAPLNKRTVLYQEQVVRTRSSILNVFLGRRGGGGGENPHKKTIRPRHNKPSSTNVELSNSSTIDL